MQQYRNSTLALDEADLSDEDILAIEKKNEEINNARSRIRLNREKINGILPKDLDFVDVVISYQSDAKDPG